VTARFGLRRGGPENSGSAVQELLSEDERRPSARSGRRAPPVRGEQTFNAILPDGRIAWLGLHPPLAPAGETRHLADLIDRAGDRRAGAIRSQSRAIRALARALGQDARRLARAQLRGDARIRRRLVAANARLDRRLSAALGERRSALVALTGRQRTFVRRLYRRDFWDQLVVVSALPLFAAFGQKGDPFAANNVALVLTLGVWLLGDDLTDLLSGSGRGLPSYLRGTDLWSYVAPFANLLTGWLLLRDQQHRRFVSGVAEDFRVVERTGGDGRPLVYTYRTHVDLAPQIAAGHVIDFITFTGVRAVAGLSRLELASATVSTDPQVVGVAAAVAGGVLTMTVTIAVLKAGAQPPDDLRASPGSLQVAWMVDTREPSS
jgi:hypothetical protein